MVITLAAMNNWVVGASIVGFLFVCLIMVLAILIQKPQGGGLSGAFGSGAGSGQTAFGAKTGDALTIATIGIFVVYIGGAIAMNFVMRPATAADVLPAAASTEAPAEAPSTPFGAGTTPAPTTTNVIPAPGGEPAAAPTPVPAPTPAAETPAAAPSATPVPAPAPTPETPAAPATTP